MIAGLHCSDLQGLDLVPEAPFPKRFHQMQRGVSSMAMTSLPLSLCFYCAMVSSSSARPHVRKDVQAGGGELAHLREGDDTDDTMTPNRYH